MRKRRKQDVRKIPLTLGCDPTLWRYRDVTEAITAGSTVLVQLIREGERLKGESPGPAPSNRSNAETVAQTV